MHINNNVTTYGGFAITIVSKTYASPYKKPALPDIFIYAHA